MEQEESMKNLAHELAKQFEIDMYKVLVKELNEPDYLPQKDFVSCRDRAAAGVMEAAKGTIDTLGLATAISREVKYGDNTTDEQALLLESGADAEVGMETWWAHE